MNYNDPQDIVLNKKNILADLKKVKKTFQMLLLALEASIFAMMYFTIPILIIDYEMALYLIEEAIKISNVNPYPLIVSPFLILFAGFIIMFFLWCYLDFLLFLEKRYFIKTNVMKHIKKILLPRILKD